MSSACVRDRSLGARESSLAPKNGLNSPVAIGGGHDGPRHGDDDDRHRILYHYHILLYNNIRPAQVLPRLRQRHPAACVYIHTNIIITSMHSGLDKVKE